MYIYTSSVCVDLEKNYKNQVITQIPTIFVKASYASRNSSDSEEQYWLEHEHTVA